MTENATKDELLAALKLAEDYSHRSLNNHKVHKMFRSGHTTVFHRVNTPEKIPVLYIFFLYRRMIWSRTFLVLDGYEGDAFAGYVEADRKVSNIEFQVIHSHAINRYIQRSKFKGTLKDAQRKILTDLIANYSVADGTDDTIYINYDNGVFLCNCDNGVMHLRTFILNRQCSPLQRMKSLDSEKGTKQFKRELGLNV